ncbi:MAG TPA: AbrB family transcriptional regulator, partial [Arenibaculum sp.]|nr:AbrB family transcriptional regulator [Arenibaculum sp.]
GLGLSGLILAYAPGGLAEMSLIALSLDLDTAFVSTHHMVRIILIVVLAPAAFRLIHRRFRTPAGKVAPEAAPEAAPEPAPEPAREPAREPGRQPGD